ncbi:DUF4878 domain-containing protein [Campylobacter sp. VBCF_05 NA6]|uniref:DUF4878 domain-containing protein n=1 Tax=unclassified Campylobacter TaxID=2593542 RepID=UPI0022E9A978|nr:MULTISPECIES: DUF4878 domain-containing protein [unclassified Campylobacter]MDA3048231.1 DUF4878 domain-containing protein [Campylobacter sp. JMF_08 NE1]MDA3057816.1 DUF4878 domain-containing protein [Campylobacter sp. VBCF_04 NA7]MDA3058810.1 DUF4878 domain-containing protein [Campylobacter sp. VBCF_05 NA6]
MKRLILAFFAMFFLIGCGGGAEDTAKACVEAIYKGDTQKVVSLIYLSEAEMKDESIKPMLEGKLGMGIAGAMDRAKKHGGVKSIKIVDKNVGADVAKVDIEVAFKDGTTKMEPTSLRKNHKGQWRILLN